MCRPYVSFRQTRNPAPTCGSLTFAILKTSVHGPASLAVLRGCESLSLNSPEFRDSPVDASIRFAQSLGDFGFDTTSVGSLPPWIVPGELVVAFLAILRHRRGVSLPFVGLLPGSVEGE
jgi:hypothetical protein